MRVCPSDLAISRLLGESKPGVAAMPEVQDPGTSPRLPLLHATLHADKSSLASDLCATDDGAVEGRGDDEDGRCSRCRGQLWEEDRGSGVRYCRAPSAGQDGRLCSLCRRRTCLSPRSLSFASSSCSGEPRRRKQPFWRQLTSTSLLGPATESDRGLDDAQCSLRAAAEEDPDFLLVRKTVRFRARRNALCEPERMLISQDTRERLERDVERRKRSLVRRFSRFLTVRLDIHTEEDLF